MEWDKIKQKWSEMTGRVQSPQLPGDKNMRQIKDIGPEKKQLTETTAGSAAILPMRGNDERSSV